MATPQRLIIGISGASGVIYGIRMLQVLRETPVETHLVISKSAEVLTYSLTHLILALAEK